MVKIVLKDGALFEGASAAEVIAQLKLDDWTAHSSGHAYKRNMARRVKNFHGERISYSTDEEFLQELNRVGFIKFLLLSA